MNRVLLALGLLGAGCNASIGGGGGVGGDDPDAGTLPGTGDASPGLADAAAPPDATPPCEGGDDRVQDPASGACYLYFQTAQTWDQARAACQALGAHLAFIDSVDESELIGTIAPATAGLQDIWVGGTDAATEGVWTWLAGGPTYYTLGEAAPGFVNWREGEPNDSDGEDCMIIEGDNNVAGAGPQWDDRGCELVYPYICER